MRNSDRFNVIHGVLLSLALSLVQTPAALAQNVHYLPLVMSGDSVQEGFLRIINHSEHAGTVRIHAIDDDGERFGPVTLSLDALQSRHFRANDLEGGNPLKGLSGGVGDGAGHWRLELDTELDIEALAYIRTPEGFVTSTHDLVEGVSMRWHVRFFNPGSNLGKQSWLRVINTSGIDTEVVIEGRDDRGAAALGGEVRFTLPADAARTLTAQELERGYSADKSAFEFEGSFGDGTGKWQLTVSAKRPIQVMSMLRSGGEGLLSNVSSIPGEDIIRGGSGADELWGGNGDDVIDPGDNDAGSDELDIVHGSAGDDRIIYTGSGPVGYQQIDYSELDAGVTVAIDGAANRATVDKGTSGTDTIVDVANPLNAGGTTPYMGPSDLFGRPAPYDGGLDLFATPFDDVFDVTLEEGQWLNVGGNAGADTFNIVSGAVRIDYATAPAGIDIDLDAGRADDDGFGDSDTVNGNVLGVAGSNFSDSIRGSDNDEVFIGRAGDDDIDGGGGVDWLRFGSLKGRLAGAFDVADLVVDLGEGTATGTWDGEAFSYTLSNIEYVRGGPGNDTLRGNDLDNLLDGGPGDDEITPGIGDDAIDGSTGNDTILYTDSHGPTWQNLQYSAPPDTTLGITATIDGVANRATVDKSPAGIDTIVDIANPMNSWGVGIWGTNSDDVFHLTVGQGQRLHVGSRAGNDTLNIESTGEVRLVYKEAPAGVDIDLGTGRVSDDGYGDVDIISGDVSEILGSEYSDMIRGSDNDELFIGRGGDDVIDGGGGFDVLNFNRSGVGNLIVNMEEGEATGTWHGRLFEYSFSNIEHVRGGAGFDILIDSEGDDTLEGGGSLDFFLMVEGGNDTIVDFSNEDNDFIFLDSDLVEEFGLTHADVIAAGRQDGGDVLIDLSTYGMGTIRLKNFNIDWLTPEDIRL